MHHARVGALRSLRQVRAPLAVFASYLVADRLFTVVAGHDGLLTPFGPPHFGTLTLGLLVLALRLIVLFALAPWIVFCLTRPVPEDRVQAAPKKSA